MEYVKLFNPSTVAIEDAMFVAAEDEKRVFDEKEKVTKVTNAMPFSIKAGETKDVEKKMAEWAMKIWGFLQKADQPANVISEDKLPAEIRTMASDVPENPFSEKNAKMEEFKQLQAIGWKHLMSKENKEKRLRYQQLKKELTI
jgi:hypothetical protein